MSLKLVLFLWFLRSRHSFSTTLPCAIVFLMKQITLFNSALTFLALAFLVQAQQGATWSVPPVNFFFHLATLTCLGSLKQLNDPLLVNISLLQCVTHTSSAHELFTNLLHLGQYGFCGDGYVCLTLLFSTRS